MSAIVLQGEASREGFQIIQIDSRTASEWSGRHEEGAHIWTRNTRAPYTLFAGTPEAREAVYSLLDARTDDQLGAFTSAYGFLHFCHRYRGGECAPVSGIRDKIDDLKKLNEHLQAGGFSEVNPLPNGLIFSPFELVFHYWLLPSEETVRGYEPVLSTPSLFAFLVHEIITLSMNNRPLLYCRGCGGLMRPEVRRDSKFCLPNCRLRHHRERRKVRPRLLCTVAP